MTYFVSTAALESRCPRCRTPILTALDEGLTARVDLTPLPDRRAEIDALLTGRWTYVRTRDRHLIYRDSHRIIAGTPRGPIHGEHKCGNRPTPKEHQ